MFKNFISEFKKFAMRGNVIDMAVGIIIGAAFGKIVDSLVKDIIMPPIGLLLGRVDFTNLFIVLKNGPDFSKPYVSLAQANAAGAVTLNIGNFMNAVISFTIVALAVFVLVKAINKLQESVDAGDVEAKEVTTKDCPYCFTSIPIKAVKCPNCTADLPENQKTV